MNKYIDKEKELLLDIVGKVMLEFLTGEASKGYKKKQSETEL